MSTERESKLQSRILQIVRKNGGYIYKNAQNMYTEKGRPDLCACIPTKLSTLARMVGEDATVGIFVGLELKREGHLNEVSDAQLIVGNKIKQAAGLWFAIDDSDIVEALMKRLTEGVCNTKNT